jgi:hypothetical protein
MKAKEIVQQHLRTVEAGNWDNTLSVRAFSKPI